MKTFSFLFFYSLFLISKSFGQRYSEIRQKRAGTCTGADRTVYNPGQSWSMEVGSKIFNCVCKSGGRTDCEWSLNENKNTRCYDMRSRRFFDEGESFTKVNRGRTLDCTCKKQSPSSTQMQIECTSSNRCHHDGKSYLQGFVWEHIDSQGTRFNCICLVQAVVSCKAKVRIEEETSSDVIEVSAPIYNTAIIREQVAGFQACDIGHRVVSAGFAWNETKQVSDDVITVKSCSCKNALITCKDIVKSRSREPHCLTSDGEVHAVGSQWVENHKYTTNLKWRCYCDGNARKQCRDESTCPDLIAPINGAMVCLSAAGRTGSNERTKYCKPLCEQGFDFQSRERRYRAYEVCGRLNSHRWSSGYVSNHLMIAKCIPTRRRYYSSYSPENCEEMTEEQKNRIVERFMGLLTRRRLCRYGCRFESFTCG